MLLFVQILIHFILFIFNNVYIKKVYLQYYSINFAGKHKQNWKFRLKRACISSDKRKIKGEEIGGSWMSYLWWIGCSVVFRSYLSLKYSIFQMENAAELHKYFTASTKNHLHLCLPQTLFKFFFWKWEKDKHEEIL